jgi:hypothetical protein
VILPPSAALTLSLSLIVFVCLSGWAPGARADSGRIVLLEPARSPGIHRIMTRIREELSAGGFAVATVDPGPATDPISMANVMERQRDAVATIALLGDPDAGSSELWILDRVGAEPQVRRIPVPSDDAERVAEVLAIRTIELLRASALKLLVESSRTARPEPPLPVEVLAPPAAEPPSPQPFVVGLETGVAVLDSPSGGLGAAALPLVRVRVPAGERLTARLTLAGFGTRPRVETSRGSAAVEQFVGLAELAVWFRSGRRLRPVASVGLGAMRVQIEGQGIFPYRGSSDDRWVTIADAGVGVLAGLGGRLALAAEAHAMIASPHPIVRFVDLEAATIGRPALLTSLTLVVWL